MNGYLKYVIENCKTAFDELCRVNNELVAGMHPRSNADVNHLGALNRMIQDYLIIRIAGLFDSDSRVISFENSLKGNSEYESIKNDPTIRYIRKLRNTFVGHNNKKRIEDSKFPEAHKIISSNLKELLNRLIALLN